MSKDSILNSLNRNAFKKTILINYFEKISLYVVWNEEILSWTIYGCDNIDFVVIKRDVIKAKLWMAMTRASEDDSALQKETRHGACLVASGWTRMRKLLINAYRGFQGDSAIKRDRVHLDIPGHWYSLQQKTILTDSCFNALQTIHIIIQ